MTTGRVTSSEPTPAPPGLVVYGKRALITLLSALLLSALVAPWMYWGLRPQERLVANLRERLRSAPEDEIGSLVAQLAQLDEPGLRALVDLSVTADGPVATAARRELLAKVEQWMQLPPPLVISRVSTAAAALAEASERMQPESFPFARHVALILLRWPLDSTEPQSGAASLDVVSDCERVLSVTADGQQAWSPLDNSFKRAHSEEAPSARMARLRARAEAHQDSRRNRDGQSSPRSPAGLGSGSDIPTPAAIKIPASVARLLPGAAPFDNAPPYRTDLPADDAYSSRQILPETDTAPDGEILSPGPHGSDEPHSAAITEIPPDELRKLDDWSLMNHLNADYAAVAIAASDELVRRGYTRKHLELAEEMTSPSVERRAALARKLLQMPELDPRPWLIQLSRDPDPRVRRAVVSVMATTTDPAIHQRLREMQLSESDPVIRHALRQTK